jgi:hypothetical protein
MEVRIKIGRVSFSKVTGKTYISLVVPKKDNKEKMKVIGKIILDREYSDILSNTKEVVFVGE